MQQFLHYTYLNNTVSDYLLFLTAIIVSFVIIKIAGYIFIKRLNAWAEKTKTIIDDLLVRGIRKYLMPIIYFTAFYLNTKNSVY